MTAARHFTGDQSFADEGIWVLNFPAACRRYAVATLENKIDVLQLLLTLLVATVAAAKRTGMVAPFLWPRTVHLTLYGIVEHVRMTASRTGMSAQ